MGIGMASELVLEIFLLKASEPAKEAQGEEVSDGDGGGGGKHTGHPPLAQLTVDLLQTKYGGGDGATKEQRKKFRAKIKSLALLLETTLHVSGRKHNDWLWLFARLCQCVRVRRRKCSIPVHSDLSFLTNLSPNANLDRKQPQPQPQPQPRPQATSIRPHPQPVILSNSAHMRTQVLHWLGEGTYEEFIKFAFKKY